MLRSCFPLSAWLVLFVFLVSLLASPARHPMFPERRIQVFTDWSRHDSDYHGGLPKKTAGVSQAPSDDAPTGAWSDDVSRNATRPQQPNGSGWSFTGVQKGWLQKLIDAQRSWTQTIHSDPAFHSPSDKTAKDPTPSGGIGASIGSGAAVGVTGHPRDGGGGSEAASTSVAGSGGGSGPGGAVAGSSTKGGSGTGGNAVPGAAGSSSANGSPGLGPSGGAAAGGGYSGSGPGASGTSDSASVPQPGGYAGTPVVIVDAQNPSASDASPGNPSSPYKSINGALRAASQLGGGNIPITILVRPGTYRETVIVQQPLTLLGQAGAEIRGSDPWSEAWTRAGNYWTHSGVPLFHSHGVCESSAGIQCHDPAHVFYDGRPLRHVDGAPTTGQFAITPDRTLILADTPEGHLVEVTTRPYWVVIASRGVTVKGFRMKHAANDTQSGGIEADGYSDITVTDNVLSDTHGAVLFVGNGSHVRIIGNDISNGGQLGVGLSGVMDSLIQSNRIHANNIYGFNSGWEAGGLKATRAVRVTVDANEVYGNDGPGLWCDGDCQDVVFSRNRIHDNIQAGIQYEISHNARIFDNVIWENGLGYTLNSNHWGWGAGILLQNSNGCQVFRNTLAWNSNGISVLEQDRGPGYLVFNTSVHDNTIVSQDALPGGFVFALAWLSDYPTKMFTLPQGNTGSSNRYGYSGAAESSWRFAWGGAGYSRLADFNATPGEHGGVYLTSAEQDSALSAARIPLSP